MAIENNLSIQNVFERRKKFDEYLKGKNISVFTCPSCGYPILNERGAFEICSICDWEDDGQDDAEADEVWGGPNKNLSLNDSRILIEQKLDEMEEQLGRKLELDPKKVIDRLGLRTLKIEAFANTIPMDADIASQFYKDYQSLKDTSLIDLFE